MATPFTLEQAQAFVREALTIWGDGTSSLIDLITKEPLLYATCIDGRGSIKPHHIDDKTQAFAEVGFAYPGGGAGILATTYAVLNELFSPHHTSIHNSPHEIVDTLVASYPAGVGFHSDDHTLHISHFHEAHPDEYWMGCGFLKMCLEASEDMLINPAGLTRSDTTHLKTIIGHNHSHVRVLTGSHEEQAIFIVLPASSGEVMCTLRRQAFVPEINEQHPCQAFVVNQRLGGYALDAYLYRLHELIVTLSDKKQLTLATLQNVFTEKMTMQINQIVARLAPHLPIYGIDIDANQLPVVSVIKAA